MMIPVDKIKDVIGKGGKVIQEMCANFNCKIDIEEDGHVFISAVDQDDAKRAIATIKTIVEDPEIGAIYKGRVTRLMNFGAFVEIAPGKEGLVHISKLDDHRVEHVEDVVAVGDPIFVMVTDIDQQGRINCPARTPSPPSPRSAPRPPSSDYGGFVPSLQRRTEEIPNKITILVGAGHARPRLSGKIAFAVRLRAAHVRPYPACREGS